ncbi:PIG-Y family protein [Streptomyces buecherae]|uniref:PIG-Y family protein n=1 Tax=Streptomyces buecherae TaxID=2763006 RepID=UPI0036610609
MPQRDEDDDEPVFKKSQWGTNRYVYNANNPIGLALIIISCVVFVVFMYLIQARKGPFEPPKQTPWSPSINENPTYPWDEHDEHEHDTPPTDATPSAYATPSAGLTPSGGESPSAAR